MQVQPQAPTGNEEQKQQVSDEDSESESQDSYEKVKAICEDRGKNVGASQEEKAQRR